MRMPPPAMPSIESASQAGLSGCTVGGGLLAGGDVGLAAAAGVS